jgi:hypothetical protein
MGTSVDRNLCEVEKGVEPGWPGAGRLGVLLEFIMARVVGVGMMVVGRAPGAITAELFGL